MEYLFATIFTVIALSLQFLLGFYLIRKQYRRLRELGKQFQFKISDLYTVVLCLAPCMYALAKIIEEPRRELISYILWTVWITGQVMWMLLGRIHVELPEGQVANALGSTLTIFGYACTSLLSTFAILLGTVILEYLAIILLQTLRII